MKKILLLGSGELGKEFVISAQRKGQHIIACDSYAGAPAMQAVSPLFSRIQNSEKSISSPKAMHALSICNIVYL